MLKDRRTYEIMRAGRSRRAEGDARARQALRPPRRAAALRAELGVTLERHELDRVYRAVIAHADREKIVSDADLLKIVETGQNAGAGARHAGVRPRADRLRHAPRRRRATATASDARGSRSARARARADCHSRACSAAATASVPEVVAAAERRPPSHAVARSRLPITRSRLDAAGAIGGAALAQGLPPLPDDTLTAARAADAILLGAVGDPKYDTAQPSERPEAALLKIRRELGLYANLRPARVWPGLESAGPLKPEVLAGTDLLLFRELTGGLYYGEPRGYSADNDSAHNTMRYSRGEVERIARRAFEAARLRRKRVTSVDKANVLEVSRLWRQVVTEVAKSYPDVTLDHMLVDTCAMRIAYAPSSFDVILTENMFGDILSDEAGAIVGSLGSAAVGQPWRWRRPLSSRCTAPRRTSPARASPTPIGTDARRRRCCCRYSLKLEEGSGERRARASRACSSSGAAHRRSGSRTARRSVTDRDDRCGSSRR